MRSLDHGRSWEDLSDRLPASAVVALAVPPEIPGSVYALTGDSLLFSPDRATAWEVRGPAPCRNPTDLAVDPGDARTAYVSCAGSVADRSEGVYRSDDGGRSWRRLPPTPADENLTALALVPVSPPRLLAGTSSQGVFVLGPRQPRTRLR
jgi:hypothetical protein